MARLMDRSRSSGRRTGRRAWAWPLLALVSAAGCKEDAFTPTALNEMKAEELAAQLKLSGLVEDGASRWALFVLAVPGKPTEHLKLKEGQCLGGLAVLSIDPSKRAV